MSDSPDFTDIAIQSHRAVSLKVDARRRAGVCVKAAKMVRLLSECGKEKREFPGDECACGANKVGNRGGWIMLIGGLGAIGGGGVN
jgi:hypothetical protein